MFVKRIIITIATATLLLTSTGPAAARGNTVERPLRGTWAGQLVDASGVDCPPGTFPSRTIASGQATHLGRFDLVTEGCTQVLGADGGLASGTASYTAANGDQIHVSFSGAFTWNADGSSTAIYPATDAWGTGRFHDVVVNATDTVIGFPDGSSIGTLDGTVTFNASGRNSK